MQHEIIQSGATESVCLTELLPEGLKRERLYLLHVPTLMYENKRTLIYWFRDKRVPTDRLHNKWATCVLKWKSLQIKPSFVGVFHPQMSAYMFIQYSWKLILCLVANTILNLRIWMCCDRSPFSSGPQNPAAQHHGTALTLQGSSEKTEPCHHRQLWLNSCLTVAYKSYCEPEESEPQVSLYCTSCPQRLSCTLTVT